MTDRYMRSRSRYQDTRPTSRRRVILVRSRVLSTSTSDDATSLLLALAPAPHHLALPNAPSCVASQSAPPDETVISATSKIATEAASINVEIQYAVELNVATQSAAFSVAIQSTSSSVTTESALSNVAFDGEDCGQVGLSSTEESSSSVIPRSSTFSSRTWSSKECHMVRRSTCPLINFTSQQVERAPMLTRVQSAPAWLERSLDSDSEEFSYTEISPATKRSMPCLPEHFQQETLV